jgi:biotin transport system substrate-specific component
MSTSAIYPTLANGLSGGRYSFARSAALAVGGSLALWLSAKLQVPFYPVPVTMQTFVVLAMGMAFGWRLSTATVALYLIQGAVGLPVFAGTPEKGIGLAYMAGPTGGYLVGFLLAAGLCGWLAERGWDRSFWTTTLAMLIGNLIIYALGLLWLGTVIGWDKPVLQFGLIPFIPGDALKVLLAALTLPFAWKLIGKREGGTK